MKIIFAQGNPDDKYAVTRHNAGWQILDAYARSHGVTFKPEKKFFADVATVGQDDQKVLLVKPTTYYNETGRSARAIVDFYKIDPATELLAIHDDLALPLGTLRVREKGSDAGNNGIKSLNAHLDDRYHRLRIGVWSELRDQIDDVAFVLGRFSAEEQKQLASAVIPKAAEIIDGFVADSHEITSHSV